MPNAHARPRPARRDRPPARRRDEPAPRAAADGRAPRRRRRSSAGCAASIPAAIAIELVFDGPPERGLRGERIASGLTVRYSGARTADAVILGIVDDVRLLDGADGTAGAPGRHRRSRPAPRRTAARRPDGRLGLAARPARRRPAGVAVGRQPARRTSRGDRRSRGQPDGRRPGRDGPARAGSRAAARRPSGAIRDGRRRTGGTGRMRP